MKKILASALVTILLLAVMTQMGWLEIVGIHRINIFSNESQDNKNKTDAYSFVVDNTTGVKYRVKAEGDYFYFYEKGQWEQKFIKGVNIGAGEPGIFPGELTISYETYYQWFEMISKMNCNSIRVYTTLRPQFYKALNDYNEQSENPLYLFQGVWMNEEDVESLADVYAENQKILNEFKQTSIDLVDVIHGKITLPEKVGLASGTYATDCSKWFGGWIIGIEWDPKFVINTNQTNPEKNSYDGTYLYTQSATPFEAFLCEVGDAVIKYETEKYGLQVPLAFANWITTDPITHPDEPHYDEDSVTVNMENIKSRSLLLPNMFISYHIYPYYPDSLNYQQDYLTNIDASGKVNTYEAYLKELSLAHTLPIVVAEFGIPTSRGLGHESVMGYNQGKVDETLQGDMVMDMFKSMYDQNYAGGIVFTWQDEWFKRTWNNVKFDIPDRRPFWSNIQTTEQCFGLLSFDPGEKESSVYIDGDVNDWVGEQPVAITDAGSLYVKSDARYVYLMIDAYEGYNFANDTLYIPLDIKSNQGNDRMSTDNISFDSAADFVITVNSENSTRILVDAYYDAFYFLYGEQYKMMDLLPNVRLKNSGNFNQMRMCYGYELKVPTTGEVVPFKSYETGKLQYGIANPSHEEYQSLADFYQKDGKIEIRIPWQLLNIMDPSQKMIMDDFYNLQVFTPTAFDKMSFGLGKKDSGTIKLNGNYTYSSWNIPSYHQRLKPAYYVLQEGLKQFK